MGRCVASFLENRFRKNVLLQNGTGQRV